MASDAYRIPFGPYDFSGIADAIRGMRENRRSMEYLQMEKDAVNARAVRESKALERQKEQDEFNRNVKAFEAVPELRRRALQDPAQANVNPFGIKFETGEDLAPGVEGPEPSPAASAARYMLNPQATPQAKAPDLMAPQRDTSAPPAGSLPRGIEGPEEVPRDDQLEELMQRAQEDVQPLGTMTMAAANAQGTPFEPKKRLFMTYKGQRSEVPEQTDETTGFGEEYDRLYNKLVDLGEKPHDAMKTVAGQFKSDQLQMAMSGRQARTFDFRNQNREDQQTFTQGENEKYKLTFEQRKELANIMARAKTEAAGAGPVSPWLAKLVAMKEGGATDEEVYAEAAKHRDLSQKEVVTPIQNVVRNAAAGERASEKRAGMEVNDTRGNFLGYAHNTTQANQLKKQTDQFAQARVRLEELIADIERTGSRVLSPNEIQQRLSKAESVNAAMRVYNGLGATDASQQLEARITGAIGTPGHGFLMGANIDVIRRILHEAEMQHDTRVRTTLRSGGGRQLAPALGGPRPQAGQIPPGAIMGTMNGKRGYVLNGEFHQTE